jgi:hypothetical protein
VFQLLLEDEDRVGILADSAQDQLAEEIGARAEDPTGDGLDAGLQPADFTGVLDAALELGVELLGLAHSPAYAGQGLLHQSLALGGVLGHGSVGSGQPETRLLVRLQLFVKFPPCGDAHHPKKKKFKKRN